MARSGITRPRSGPSIFLKVGAIFFTSCSEYAAIIILIGVAFIGTFIVLSIIQLVWMTIFAYYARESTGPTAPIMLPKTGEEKFSLEMVLLSLIELVPCIHNFVEIHRGAQG